ncbi:MAG: sugar phosphate isomerase/epimerase family protein [Armatimonadota bacterium]
MKIGAMDSVLRQPWSNLCHVAAELGFDGVELGVGPDYAETMLWSEEGRRELKAAADDAGVPIASVCVHAFWQISFSSDDQAVRDQATRMAREAAAGAAAVGAEVLLFPVTLAEGVSPRDGKQRWIEGMQGCAQAALDNGVIFALENVGRSFATTGPVLAETVDAVGSPGVKAYFDPGNALSLGGDPVPEIGQLGERIAQVHIKDPGGHLLGEGNLDLPGVIAALKDVGYDGWLVLETPATEDPKAAGAHNLDYLRKLLEA